MKKITGFFLVLAGIVATQSCNNSSKIAVVDPAADTLKYADESHFKNVQQLTFGGDNAEAYWSYDGKYLVFQRTNPKDGIICDQMFVGKVPTKKRGEVYL